MSLKDLLTYLLIANQKVSFPVHVVSYRFLWPSRFTKFVQINPNRGFENCSVGIILYVSWLYFICLAFPAEVSLLNNKQECSSDINKLSWYNTISSAIAKLCDMYNVHVYSKFVSGLPNYSW